MQSMQKTWQKKAGLKRYKISYGRKDRKVFTAVNPTCLRQRFSYALCQFAPSNRHDLCHEIVTELDKNMAGFHSRMNSETLVMLLYLLVKFDGHITRFFNIRSYIAPLILGMLTPGIFGEGDKYGKTGLLYGATDFSQHTLPGKIPITNPFIKANHQTIHFTQTC